MNDKLQEQKLKDLQEKVAVEQRKLDNIVLSCKDKNAYLLAIQEDIKKIEAEKVELNKSLISLNNQSIKMIADIEKKRTDYNRWEDNKRAEIFALESKAKEKETLSNQTIESAKREVAAYVREKADLQAEIAKYVDELDKLDNEIKIITTRSMIVEDRERKVSEREVLLDKDEAAILLDSQELQKKRQLFEAQIDEQQALIKDITEREKTLAFGKGKLSEKEAQLTVKEASLEALAEKLKNKERDLSVKEVDATNKLLAARGKEERTDKKLFDAIYKENQVNHLIRINNLEKEMKKWENEK